MPKHFPAPPYTSADPLQPFNPVESPLGEAAANLDIPIDDILACEEKDQLRDLIMAKLSERSVAAIKLLEQRPIADRMGKR